jgi:hypothetical protein
VPAFFSEWTCTSDASMSNTTGPVPVVAALRAHGWERTLAIACHKPDSVPGLVWRNVRYSVESDGHEPEQGLLHPEHLDVGARLAAPGQHQHRLDQDLAPVMEREPLPGRRDPRRRASPTLNRSANHPRACRPTWATTPRHRPRSSPEQRCYRSPTVPSS